MKTATHTGEAVVGAGLSGQASWVGRGRNRTDVHPFFEWLGKRRCKKVRAVAMDMASTFELEVRGHCPNAEIALDPFLVVANFGHQVIDRIRVNEANRCRDDKAAREPIKGAKWLLLGNRESWLGMTRASNLES